MIQAPMSAYSPAMMMLPACQQPVMQTPVQQNTMQQTPGYYYNYPTASSYMPAKSQYNGVNIEIINPQGQGMPVPTQTMPATFYPMQPVAMPAVAPMPFPQQTSNLVVNPAPAQPVEQPVYTPAQTVAPQVAQPTNNFVGPVAQPAQPVAQQPVAVPPPVIQQTPEAQATQNVAPAAAPVIEPAVAPDPSVTPESFAARLNTSDLAAQKTAIEEIAETVKNNETAGPILLDEQIFDALVNIINKDTSALAGPTPEILELRNKDVSELTEAEKTKAYTPSELEKAEINKQYALYTIAYMQERLNNELEKRGATTLELKDLPCIENVITATKENPNPMLRISGLASLSHISRPEYKADLTTIFELAKADEDPKVQEAATKALEALNS